MNNTFVIGDPHFWHNKIIDYCSRPFSSVEEMNETLIDNWNKIVKKDDIVIVNGDFALCGKNKLIEVGKRLKGRKRLILGNHDGASLETYREAGFEYIYNYPIIVDNFFIVSHMPQPIFPNGLYANIYAHVHNDLNFLDYTARSFCTSVERIDYAPINLEDIKQVMGVCAGEVYGE